MGSLRNSTLKAQDVENLWKQVPNLWVFGYGSILWHTGFNYSSRRVGRVSGYVRRFWQGNTTHRGTPESPGRVATLVEESNGEVWGAAFELRGKKMIRKALRHLGLRECLLGGYTAAMVPVQCRQDPSPLQNDTAIQNPALIYALVFMATADNAHYAGPAPEPDIARQVIGCTGPSGHNIEYVAKLADYIRSHIPEERDAHLFEIDNSMRRLLREKNVRVEHFYATHSPRGMEVAMATVRMGGRTLKRLHSDTDKIMSRSNSVDINERDMSRHI